MRRPAAVTEFCLSLAARAPGTGFGRHESPLFRPPPKSRKADFTRVMRAPRRGQSPNKIGRWRIAVGGSGVRCHGCDSCTSQAVSHSSDRLAAGFPVDCWSGSRRCGPTPMRGAGPATCSLRHRSRSSPTERRRDTAERSERGWWPSTPRRIRASVSYWCRAGPTPDMHYRSRSSDCASRVVNRNRDTVSRVRRYDRLPTTGRARYWSLLSGLNR
jgi:hypothetical protein